ncbi:MAG: T9SS type A sorting domain-containing protein [Candidatus Kapabacteria bacterium]|nr:T9SS type A sorting domain-containing protein [Ignavibacteriota bacterium]MCW5883509.1 T9SS type A sorting domain-containing protein [Candidatus Kapabacteria bacterium]
MKHKMFLFVAALVLLFSNSNPVCAVEITVNWRTIIDSTQINDLKFMPGEEQFIVGTGFDVQVRSCEDGGKVNVYPFGAWRIEFTPDSNRIVSILPIYGYKTLQLRNVNDMSLISEYVIPEDEEGYGVSFSEMKVDPVRPYIYTILKGDKDVIGTWVRYRKILIFDRETLQPVGELTTAEDEKLLLVNLAVSNDGKYLAVMNEGRVSKLMVWSLDSRQKIVDKYISDPSSKEWSDPADVKFSELNTDKIYFTGQFYQEFGKETFNGLCIYSINEKRIIDSTFALSKEFYAGPINIVFFDNEAKVLGMANGFLRILDFQSKSKIFEKSNIEIGVPSAYNAIYNQITNYFIGTSSRSITKFQYQPGTDVLENKPQEIIYPNPTSGIVNIPLNCINSSKYEIYNTSGRLVNSTEITGATNNLLTIDFTQYPSGVYSVKVYCGKNVLNYQVVRGE